MKRVTVYAVFAQCRIKNDRTFVKAGQIALIYAQLVPVLIERLHKPVNEVRVDFFGGNMVLDGRKTTPFAILVPDENGHEQRLAAVVTQQSFPCF